MSQGRSEPVRTYWAIGIAASVALHASGVAAAILLGERYARNTVPTEITFSATGSPTARQVSELAEVAAASETAAVVAPEKPAAAAAAVEAREPQPPVASETMTAAGQETLTPSMPETVSAPLSETAPPLDTGLASVASREETAALAPEQAETSVGGVIQARASAAREAAEAASPQQAETVTGSLADAVEPSVSTKAFASSDQELAAKVSDSDSVSVLPGPERLVPPPAATAPSDGSPERIAVREQSVAGEALSAIEPGKAEASGNAERLPAETPGATVAVPAPSVTGARPEVLGPSVAPPSSHVGETVAPGGGQETVTPIERPLETALLVPARPGSVLGTEVDKPSDRYRRIVDFVRRYAGGDCFIALPAMNAAGGVTFQTFGRDKALEDAFRQALLGLDGLRAEISSGNVADPQCLALSFARDASRYPGFSLIIDLDEDDMKSGARLSGSVLNANGRELHLLVIDDEGLVQSLDRFLAAGDVDRAFSVPLTLTGGPVETKQILIAIATSDRLAALAGPFNEPAESYFRRLSEQIESAGADIDLAVEGFSVR